MDGVYPLCFPISREEFFIDKNVLFGVDTCSGSGRGPFNGAVDAFVVEAFIDETDIASDPSVSGPAVNVTLAWVCWIGEEIHGRLGDAFLGGAYGAVV